MNIPKVFFFFSIDYQDMDYLDQKKAKIKTTQTPDLKWNLRHEIKAVTYFLNYPATDSHSRAKKGRIWWQLWKAHLV